VSWTVIVPAKGAGPRKTRLAGRLDDDERRELADRLLQHVLGILDECAEVSEVVVLSDQRPVGWHGRLAQDQARGLNPEIQALCNELGGRQIAVIHADLPLLQAGDVHTLLAAAQDSYGAIAPDRHGTGTNAIALQDTTGFEFAFGPGSFAQHCANAAQPLHVVRRRGLSVDIDTPDDLDYLNSDAISPA